MSEVDPTGGPGADVELDGEPAPGADQAPLGAARTSTVARMSVLTAVSRITGFGRVVVVAAVLGTSYLGNTYQSANTVPNILFELFAAGVLQSVLVPVMVQAIDQQDHRSAERTAGVILGAVLALLSAVVAAGLVAAPWVMRLMVSGVDDPAVRDAQIALGTFLLWFFLPQILFYGANLVSTAVLNARGYFALPVFAPTVNNVVVISTYLVFGAMRGGQPPSLDLTTAEKLVLAIGTTMGVVAFCAVPVIGLWVTGFHVRPRLHRDPILRRVARSGAWAAGFLALTQALLVVVLFLANGVEGGVVVYQLAYVLFMLPHALFSVPVFTTAFPTLARLRNADDWSGFGAEVARAARSIAMFTAVSAAALVALAGPLSHLVARGNAAANVDAVAGAIAGFALGLPGFSFMLFLTRVSYADNDTKSPTLANLVVAIVGAVTMTLLASRVDSTARVALIGVGYTVAQLIGAVTLASIVRRRIHHHGATVPGVVVPVLRVVVSAVLGGLAAWAVVRVVGEAAGTSGLAAVPAAVSGGVVLALVAVSVIWLLGGPTPVRLARTLGGDPGRIPGRPAGGRVGTGRRSG